MNTANKEKSKLKLVIAIPAIILILLFIAVLSMPAIISTTFVRNTALSKINENPDIEVQINDWSARWRDGIRAEGIAVDLKTVPAHFTADSFSADISILSAVRLALTINKAQTRPVADPGVRGKIELSNAFLSVLAPSGPEPVLENMDFTLDIVSLTEKWPFQLHATQERNNGKLALNGGIALLQDSLFKPDRISADLELQIENIAIFPIITALETNQAMPEVSGLLNGNFKASFAGIGALNAGGEIRLGPIEVKGVSDTDDTTVFEPIKFSLDVSGKENKINIADISLESDFTQFSVSGTLSMTDTGLPGDTHLNVTGHLDTDKLTVFAGETFMSWKPDPALLKGGMINIEADIKTDLSDQPNILQATKATALIAMTNVNLGVFSHIPSAQQDQPVVDCMLGAHLKISLSGPEHIQAEGRITTTPITLELPEFGEAPLVIAPVGLALNIAGEAGKITISDFSLSGDIITASITGAAELEESGALKNLNAGLAGKLNMPAIAGLAAFAAKQPLDPDSKPEDWGTLDFKADINCQPDGSTNLVEHLNLAFEANLRNLHFFPIARLADTDNTLPSVNGAMNADVNVSLKGIDNILANVDVSAPGIFMAGGFFGSDKPAIRNIKIAMETAITGNTVDLRSFSLDSSLLSLALAGNFTPGKDDAPPVINFNPSARLDLAELARQMPATLGIRENLSFKRGELTALARLRSKAADIEFDTKVSIGEIEFELDGVSSGFENLLTLTATGAAGDNPQIQDLSITAPFLSGHGAGDLKSFKAELKADIGAALRDAGKFVDLAGKSAEGTLDLTLGISELSGTASKLKAEGALSTLNIAGFSEKPATLPATKINAGAVLNKTQDGALHDITDASFQIASELLSLKITNKRFVPGAPEETVMDDLVISARSNLETLFAFASGMDDSLDDISIKGEARLDGKSAISDGVFKIPEINLALNPFEMRTKDGLLVERGIKASGNFQVPLGNDEEKPSILSGINSDMDMKVGYIRHFGVEISDVNVPVRIADSKIALRVMSKVNEGTVNLPVNIDMSVEPNILEIPDNTLALDRFQLTDAMVEELLGMIAPVLKGCAVTSGDISLRMNRCSVPLDEQHKMNMEFSSSVVFRQVVLASAGMILELLDMARISEREITIPDQEVATVLQNGRFYSSPLNIRIGPHAIVVSGSVGLDETLDYNVQIPLTRELVGGNVYQYVEGRTANLPIGGTISSPGIDKKRFAAEIARITASAAKSEKGKEAIDKGLREGIRLLDGVLGR